MTPSPIDPTASEKLTKEDLEKRVWELQKSAYQDIEFGGPDYEFPDELKQLIKDVVEAVTPEGRSYPANLNGSLRGQGFADAIDTIEQNTKELLDD